MHMYVRQCLFVEVSAVCLCPVLGVTVCGMRVCGRVEGGRGEEQFRLPGPGLELARRGPRSKQPSVSAAFPHERSPQSERGG